MVKGNIKISVVIPLFNEEESVAPLYCAVTSAMELLNMEYELLFVNDGSSDLTFERSCVLANRDERLRVVEFRKNYGQTPAMAAGIDLAKGEIIVTMDGDLQNDPSDIPMMVNKLQEGYDVVVGWRYKRQDTLISRKIPSIIANNLIGKVTGVPIKDNGCSLKVYRASVIKNIPFYSEMHRFIPAMMSLSGAKCAEVKVKHHARQFGESKYGISRVYKVLMDLLTVKTLLSLSVQPIAWFAKLSLVPFLVCLFCLVGVALQYSAGGSLVILSTISLLTFSLGVFTASLGFLCELIYKESPMRISDFAMLTANDEAQTVKDLGVLPCPLNWSEKS